MKKRMLLSCLLAAALALTACAGKDTETAPSPTPDLNAPATMPDEDMEIDPEFGVTPEDAALPEPDSELRDMIDTIYAAYPVDLMMMETAAIDLTNADWYTYQGGFTAENVDKVDAAVINEPMTGSQAYSLVLARVKDSNDAKEIADSMLENISLRKWVCVEASKARVVTFGDKVLYVMADSELADVDALVDAAATALNVTFDTDQSVEADPADSELPPELLQSPAVVQ